MTLLISLFLLSLIFLSFPFSVSAQCPVCIVTVGGGMLIAKKLGIDDLLISIWISALNTALAYWLAPKIKTKFLNHPLNLSLLLLITTLAYFYITQQLFHSTNQLFGLDKIVTGQVLGLLSIISGNFLYQSLKQKNGNKTVFPYAKVFFPVFVTLLITLLFKFAFTL